MPTKPKTRKRSNQKAGRKKHTRTRGRAKAKQMMAPPSTRTRGRSSSRATESGSGSRSTAASKTTTDLDEIIAWAEARGGEPATVRGTGEEEEAGILRIDFPGGAGEDVLEHISWDEWYDKFQENELAFLYQEKTKDGKISRFFKLVKQ
jgi:hypothetical protein